MTEPKQLFLYHAAVSDTGSVRTNNEDAFLEVPERGLFIVSDGMGGAAAGEVASQMTIDGMRLACADLPYVDTLPGGPLQRRQQVFAWFRRSLEKINTELQEKAQADSSKRGMGCTLAAVLFQGNGVFLAHVGDSRVYLLRQDILYQMTEDHSLGQEFLSAGALTAEQVAKHPQRNVLTRALGPFPKVEIDTAYFEIMPGDVYSEVSHEKMRQALLLGPAKGSRELLREALEAGGHDNITALVVAIAQDAAIKPAILGSKRAREVLAKSVLFASFTQYEITRLQKLAVGREFEVGEVLIEQGQTCDFLMVILEGQYSLWRDGETLGTEGPGEPFGELSLRAASAPVTARAETKLTALEFPLAELRGLLSTDSAMAAKLAFASLERLSSKLRGVVDSFAEYRSVYGPSTPEIATARGASHLTATKSEPEASS